MIFDCTVPITWADIINFISTFLALIAVVVAVISIKVSFKIQEQSKNVDLYEKRLALIEELKNGNPISEISLRLLYKKSIFEEYEKLKKKIEEKKNAEHDLYIYEQNAKMTDEAGGFFNPLEEIREKEAKIELYGETDESKKEFEELCQKHQITFSEFGEPENSKVYNYIDLSKKIGKKNLEAENQLKKLLKKMEEEIAKSISSLD